MKITVEERNGAQTSLKVEVPREAMKREFEQSFRRLAKDATIPGFRKGRIPRKLFELRFGTKGIREEALKSLSREAFRQALKQENLSPIIPPEMEVIEFSQDNSSTLRMEVVSKPKVKLGVCKGLKVKRNAIEVGKKEVTSALEDLQRKYAQYPLVEERDKAGERDWLVIDWEAFYQGKKLSGEEGKNFVLKVGSSVFPAEFSHKITGVRLNQSKSIEVEFPSDYPRADFRGRKIQFQIRLKEIREEKLPSLNDDFARDLKFKSLEDMKDRLREQIKKIKKNLEERRVRYELVSQATSNAQLEIPPLLLKRKTEERIGELASDLSKKGLTLPQYLKEKNLEEKEFREKVQEEVEGRLRNLFVLNQIAQDEKIEVSEEELEEKLRVLARGKKKEELEELEKSLVAPGQLDQVNLQIRHDKVIEFLYQHSKSSGNKS